MIPTPSHLLGRISPISSSQAGTQGQETAGTGVQTAGNTVSAVGLTPGVGNAWQLVAIEAKHQQATAKLGAEVRELRQALATESTALQAAQALNEKLFNEMHSVT